MQTLFSTRDVHPRDRFDYWHSVACKNLVEHDSLPDCRQAFEAEIQSAAIGDIDVIGLENSAMTVSHVARHVSRENDRDLFICRQGAGRLILEQSGREVVLEPSDMTLLDPRQPYAARFSAGSTLLVLKVPRRLLEARVGGTQAFTACAVRSSDADGSLMSAYLGLLSTLAGRLGPATEVVAKEHLLDLFAVSLANATDGRRPSISSARSLVVMKLRGAIDSRLTDPALDAATVAAAAGVSIRYANDLLADDDTSIVRLIYSRRLERCRKALEDPAQAHRSVSDIAYGWGFSDMTHFGRKFRAAYGLLPSIYRKA